MLAILEEATVPHRIQALREMPGAPAPVAYRGRALKLMQEAVKLIDEAERHSLAAAHLQHAIDVLHEEPPQQH